MLEKPQDTLGFVHSLIKIKQERLKNKVGCNWLYLTAYENWFQSIL
jgi:hypothetical protein